MGQRPLHRRLGDEASLEGYRSEEAWREAIYDLFASNISLAVIAIRFDRTPAEV